MKAQKRLNVILVVLIIVLVSIISFVGIFYQSRNEMVSRIPEYKSGTNIKGHRIVTLEVSEDGKTSGEESTENKTTENEMAENETSNKYAERASGGVMDLLQQKHVCCADLDGEIEQYASKLLHLLQMSICYFV